MDGDDERVAVVVLGPTGWRWFGVPNLHATPRTHFELDPRVFWEAASRGEEVRLVIHSHPRGPECLSQADRAALRSPDGDPWFPGVLWGVVAPSADGKATRGLRVFDATGAPLWSLG